MRNLKKYPITDDEAIVFMEFMLVDYKNASSTTGDLSACIMEYIIEQLSNYKDLKES